MTSPDRTIEEAGFPPWRFSVAPMMDWTDRHCRFLHRQMTRRTLLFTEMVTSAALVRGGAWHLLDHSADEAPVALQLGGSEPAELAEAARAGAARGYAEINLNVGCPSDRVQSGCFGAVLMKDPELVGACLGAMQDASSAPVTVKCRIGVDDQDPNEALPAFLDAMQAAGVTRIAVHARKAWLDGLSPAQNREIPPLEYDLVAREAAARPDLDVILNGGISSLDEAEMHLARGFAGVMIGRAAYHRPGEVLLTADSRIHGAADPLTDEIAAVRAMRDYISDHVKSGGKLGAVTRHMLGLFTGRPGARVWRRRLSENVHRPGAGWEVVEDALSAIDEAACAA